MEEGQKLNSPGLGAEEEMTRDLDNCAETGLAILNEFVKKRVGGKLDRNIKLSPPPPFRKSIGSSLIVANE